MSFDSRCTGASTLCVFAVFLLACSEEPAPPPEVAQRVTIVTFGEQQTEERLEFPGVVAASDRAETSFEVAGRIIEISVREGEQVEAGQVMARLDPSNFQAEFEKQQALVNSAKVDFERQKVLLAEGVAPKQEFDRAERNYEVASANLRIAQKAMEDTELRAPFRGRVGRRLVEQFQNVQAKEAVISFQSDSAVEIKVAIPERDAARMPVGASLEERTETSEPEVVVSALPGQAFPAQLTEFATAADPTTRTFAATLAFEVPPGVNVLPGMTASVRVHARGAAGIGGLSLPANAVRADADGGASVWVVDPETLRVAARVVEIGEISGTDVRVLSGIEEGEWVATTGVHQLREGMLVQRPRN